MEPFTMAMPSEVSETGFIEAVGEFFYSIKNDTLYFRNNSKEPWLMKCDGGCNDMGCPVRYPDRYYFFTIDMSGTKLPKEAVRR